MITIICPLDFSGIIIALETFGTKSVAGYVVGAITFLIALGLASAAVCDFLLLAKVSKNFKNN